MVVFGLSSSFAGFLWCWSRCANPSQSSMLGAEGGDLRQMILFPFFFAASTRPSFPSRGFFGDDVIHFEDAFGKGMDVVQFLVMDFTW